LIIFWSWLISRYKISLSIISANHVVWKTNISIISSTNF
jgi:hypothetical protein